MSIGLGDPNEFQGWDNYRRFTGMEGLPGMGQGGLLPMAGGMLATSAMGSYGLLPMGLTDQNMYGRLRARQATADHDSAIQRMAALDRPALAETMRGAFLASGTAIGPQQEQAIRAIGQGLSGAGGLALTVLGPRAMDDAMGYRGSAMAMTHWMAMATQNQRDPFTNKIGWSADTLTKVGTQIFQQNWEGDRWQGAGMTAGRAGELYLALSQRGLAPGLGMEAMGAGGTTGQLPKLDAKKFGTMAKDWSAAISAMSEIFGAAGQPDAPFPQLVKALDSFTNGSLAQIGVRRANMLARGTIGLAERAGIGVEAAMMWQQQTTALAGSMGLEPIFGVTMNQAGMAARAAYTSMGMAANAGWGGASADEMHAITARARGNAIRSQMGNQIGLLGRLREAGGLREGTDAWRAAQAALHGETHFMTAAGKRVALDMTEKDFAAMITSGSGGALDKARVYDMLAQREENREYLSRDAAAGSLVQRSQGDYLSRRHQNVMTGALVTAFRGAVGGKEGVEFSRQASAAIDAALRRGEDPGANATERSAFFSRTLSQALKGTAGYQQLLAQAGGDEAELGRRLGLAGEQAWGRLERLTHGRTRAAYGAVNAQMLATADSIDQQVNVKSLFDSAMAQSQVAGKSMLGNFIRGLQDIKPGDEAGVQKAFLKMFGGVDPDKLGKVTGQRLQQLHGAYLEAQEYATKYANARPEDRPGLSGHMETRMKAYRTVVNTLLSDLEKAGVSKESITRELDASGKPLPMPGGSSVVSAEGVGGGSMISVKVARLIVHEDGSATLTSEGASPEGYQQT